MMVMDTSKTVYYAILSGACAASASFCGKLCGLPVFEGSLIILRALFFCMMLIFNGGVWTLYVKALQASTTSLTATVVSAASNYFLSAIIGFLIFKEVATLWWWSGMTLVFLGLILIANDSPAKDIIKKH